MLANLLETASTLAPARVTVRHGDRDLTAAELVVRTRRLAHLIAAENVGTCVYIGVNGPTVPLTLFACARAGIPFAPLNYRLTRERIGELLGRLDRPLVISDDVRPDDVPVVSAADWWAASERGGMPAGFAGVDGDAIATVLFTSGTTAEPKAVPLRHANLSSYVLNSVDLMGAAEDEATLVSVPPYHVAAIGSTLTNVLAGRRIVYLPDFDPSRWLETVDRERVTAAMVVPTMLARVLDELGDRQVAAKTLRNIAYGGARCSPELVARALAAFPDVGFTNAYGLTETSSTLTILGPEEHRAAVAPGASERERARLGSAGLPIPGVELQVRAEDGAPLPPGEVGELWVRGAQVSGEYLDDGGTTALDSDGWFRTRDGGYLDEDGYLYVTGRIDDTIIRGAENINPAEIEDVVVTHPSVRDVAVVGVPDAEWGERIAAAVVLCSDDVRPDDLREWARSRLRSSRTPDEVHIVAELPYGPTGKLLRRELVAELTARGESNEEEGR